MRTAPLISFGLYALAIKQDSTPACDDLQTFAHIDDLKTGNISSRPYITYEPNFWLLSGEYKFMPTVSSLVHVGLMSLSMSDASGNFADPPQLVVTFESVHTTDGLILKFAQYSNDYCADLDVAFYDDTDTLIRSDNYTPTTYELSTAQAVTDFKKIIITFNSTNKAYRYLRVEGINFGQLTYFTGADIKSAVVVEEVNPLSTELSIDTLDLKLYSSDAAFSIINPSGDYSILQNKQPLDVYEIVGNEQKYIGQFFLDEWQNPSNNEIEFRCIDMIGVLDSVPYLGGIWLTPTTAGALIEEIMTAIDTPYNLDTDLISVAIAGWLPVCTYREALQQIAFACGAYVTCSRAGNIQILKTVLASDVVTFDGTITKAEKGVDQSLTLKTLVTGVEVTAHDYIESTESIDLYNASLTAGTHTIKFNEPMHDLSVTGATVASSGANYAVLTVASTGTVVLSGQRYTDTTQVYGVYNTTLDSNVRQNVLSINSATLVNASNVATVTQRVYDYHQQRYLQKVKLYAPNSAPGESVLIDTLYDQQIGGVIEKMELNLTGGFTVRAEIVGVVNA